MDRNSIIGLLLIAAIILGYSYLTRPSEEEIKAMQKRDSIAQVELKQKQMLEAEHLEALKKEQLAGNKTENDGQNVWKSDAPKVQETITLENNLLKLSINTLGGGIEQVQVKNFKTYDDKELLLWGKENAKFGMTFYADNKPVNTQVMFFESVGGKKSVDASSTKQSVVMRLSAEEGKYIEYKYTLAPDSYKMNFEINVVGMQDIIAINQRELTFNWAEDIPAKEKGRTFENQYSALYYKFSDDDTENLSATGEDAEDVSTKVKWIAFKQQFFSSVLIADKGFKGLELKSVTMDDNSPILKHYSAAISLPYNGTKLENYPMQFYFGPNQYSTLRKYGKDINLESLIDLGWGIFGWVNRFVVIPIFDLLGKYISNYGIIILILTIIIKLVLSPLTYKSYLSTAKMKVLKPQIDEINERIPKEKTMERQQATMALYKKAGVNPMGGCLPMLVQFPILIAMFRFFPASFELRQKSFLWASDLSSYDSIAQLPFSIPFYGDHISLFCLLMAVTNLIYTHMNSQMQSSQQMPGMKAMMYLMPIMFLFWFNSYASGLSYYYFIATLFTIIQTWAIRKYMVDDEKVLAMLEANKKKPVKKSRFQQRLEEAAKQRGYKPKK